MAITTPQELVDEYKRSGAFDRFRRELLTSFQRSEVGTNFIARVEEIASKKLAADGPSAHRSRDAAHSELMKELERCAAHLTSSKL
ncbi:hypothetical protein BOTBODRAFT_354130 [Botryobasidium botryosum FD-172 SS1]|uniref:BOD1/SHG1 domain-containing protein n=1 Tax=Botryobasidium botryosum (strain FD-172 SS1) TaxID=930990 RepID=A0A067MQT7_BOTB1|nr:hypothetical protein BOTBODRAFT_354130 [Botryobasidium botryosum FD-172 SS1]